MGLGTLLPVIGSAVGGFFGGMPGAQLGAGLGGLVGGQLGQQEANAQNVALSREQMDFQREMRSTAYQTAVKDMQAAGLNPMLAYQQGGAATPAGAMTRVENEVGAGVNSAATGLQIMKAVQEITANQAQIELVKAQTKEVNNRTLENYMYSGLAGAQIASTEAGAQKTAREAERAFFEWMDARDTWTAKAAKPEGKPSQFETDVRMRKAQSRLQELQIPEAEAAAKFWQTETGAANPFFRQIMELLKGAVQIGKGFK